MPEWTEDKGAEQGAALLLRARGTSELDARRRALKELEGAGGELRLRLIAEPEETHVYCRELLAKLYASDELSDLPLDEKWQRRRDGLEMSLTNFLAQSLVEIGDWEGAAATYEHCLRLGAIFQEPDFEADSLLKLGRAYRHAGKLADAQKTFERAATLSQLYGLHNMVAEALYQQAVVAELEHRVPDAFERYRAGLKLSEGEHLPAMSIRFLSQLGQLHQSLGEYPPALDHYDRCLKLLRETDNDPESETILLGQICHINVEINDFAASIAAAQEGLDLSRQTGQQAEEEAFLNDLARLYRQQADLVQARAYATQARDLARTRGDRQGVQIAEEFLEKLNQLERQNVGTITMEFNFESAHLNDDEPTYYYRRGNRYYNRGAYDRAISAYSRALTLNPEHISAYINRGSAYTAKGNYDRALADYNQALELDSTDPITFFNRGNAYRKRREYERALHDYSQAINLAPQDPDAYFNRGEVLRRLKRFPEAAADFRKVIDLSSGRDEPGAQEARQLLADMGF